MGDSLWFSSRIRGNGGDSDRSHVACHTFVPLWKADQTQIGRLESYQLVRKGLLNCGLQSIVVFYILHILSKNLDEHVRKNTLRSSPLHFLCRFEPLANDGSLKASSLALTYTMPTEYQLHCTFLTLGACFLSLMMSIENDLLNARRNFH